MWAGLWLAPAPAPIRAHGLFWPNPRAETLGADGGPNPRPRTFGPNPRSRTFGASGAESEPANFPAPIRGHGLFGASGADPSLRTEFSGGRPAGRIQVEKIFWWSAGGAHPSRKDFPSAGKTKWVTNPISKSDHMAPDMCI